ncbi:MAG TPA: hypothetical protein VF644_10030 [Pyrinomonadaceae bacterium]|jgi:hypothetical protein
MKSSIWLCLLYLLVTQSIYAQTQNDLEVFNLKGKIKTVRIERSKFITEGNENKEGRREPQELMTFDEKGYYTERAGLTNSFTRKFAYQYYPDGKIKERTDLVYSQNEVFTYTKNLIVKTTQLKDGHILDKWIYHLDENGKKIKEEYILVDKNLGERLLSPPEIIVYKYDLQQKLIETAYFKADNSPAVGIIFSIHKYINTYADRNRISERLGYKLDNTLIVKWAYKYNQMGLLEEATRFGLNLKPLSKVTYSEFDEAGNWTKSGTFKISDKDGKTVIEPTEIEYRTITYYP